VNGSLARLRPYEHANGAGRHDVGLFHLGAWALARIAARLRLNAQPSGLNAHSLRERNDGYHRDERDDGNGETVGVHVNILQVI